MAPVQETFTEALEFTSDFTPKSFPTLTQTIAAAVLDRLLHHSHTLVINA